MRTFQALALLIALPLGADVVARVEGRVFFENEIIPGCNVTLSGASLKHKTVSDVNGRYKFLAIPGGEYELTFEVPGFETETRRIVVDDAVEALDAEIRIAGETTVTSCWGMPPCSETAPETAFELPACADYELNTSLIQSIQGGDRSAINLLRQRYKTTISHVERHRMASSLLTRVPDDREYWNELAEKAADAIRFAFVDDQPTEDFLAWCASRRFDPLAYRWMTIDALKTIAADRRAHALLVKALESHDRAVFESVFRTITFDRDETLLPAIEKNLGRFPEHMGDDAFWLLEFASEAADRVAMKFLSEERQKEYRKRRQD